MQAVGKCSRLVKCSHMRSWSIGCVFFESLHTVDAPFSYKCSHGNALHVHTIIILLKTALFRVSSLSSVSPLMPPRGFISYYHRNSYNKSTKFDDLFDGNGKCCTVPPLWCQLLENVVILLYVPMCIHNAYALFFTFPHKHSWWQSVLWLGSFQGRHFFGV